MPAGCARCQHPLQANLRPPTCLYTPNRCTEYVAKRIPAKPHIHLDSGLASLNDCNTTSPLCESLTSVHGPSEAEDT